MCGQIIRKLAILLTFIAATGAANGQFISQDTYTRYELLAPETHQFKIYYEVTELRAGSKYHYNPIREGSEASDESVLDPADGKPLKFEVVTAEQAKADDPGARLGAGQFIRVHLAH